MLAVTVYTSSVRSIFYALRHRSDPLSDLLFHELPGLGVFFAANALYGIGSLVVCGIAIIGWRECGSFECGNRCPIEIESGEYVITWERLQTRGVARIKSHNL